MRRILSILLLLAFGLAQAMAAIPAMLTAGESSLPACCRRGGAHHCAMGRMGGTANPDARGETALEANSACPFTPATMAVTAPTLAAVPANSALPVLAASEFCARRGAASIPFLPIRRSQPKRGPPALRIA